MIVQIVMIHQHTTGFIESSYVDTSTYSVGSDIFNATNTPFSSAGNCQMSRLGGNIKHFEYQRTLIAQIV